MKKIFLILCFNIVIMAQVENTVEKTGTVPMFFYDLLVYKSTQPSKTRLDVYVEVPYKVIQFVKSAKGFTASYSITISIFDEDGERMITERSWNETVDSKDFESTTSLKNYYLSYKTFDLVPNKYSIRCEVIDQDSKKNYIRNEVFDLRELSPPVAISDLLMITKEIEIQGKKRMVPNVSRNVATQKDGVNLYYEVYSDTLRTAEVEYKIVDNKDNELFSAKEKNNFEPKINQVNHSIGTQELPMGEYKVIVSIMDSTGNLLTSVSKTFYSRWVGMPSSVKDLDKAIEQMVYIAKESELDNIEDLPTKEERQKKYIEFWKAKDPTPNTEENEVFEEYYRRVEYSNMHFKHYIEGWKTDMGMIYITLGPPNNVERHPFEFDSKPYEVWDYYDINKRFIFVDQTGFGDYRLITPVYGSWWRYRP